MLFNFGGDDRLQSARPPLARVIAAMRYPTIAALSGLAGIAPIQERLLDAFPELREDEQTQLEITFGSTLQQQQSKQPIFRFSGHQAGYEIAVAPSATQLTVGSGYRNREEFAGVLTRVCDALSEGVGVKTLTGFAARYVNAVPTEAEWQSWWNPAILGWVMSTEIEAPQRASITQTVLTGGEVELPNHVRLGTSAVIRHGLVPGVGPDLLENATATQSFIIDCELTSTQQTLFSTSLVNDLFRQYNHEIARFFSFSLTDAGREHFAVVPSE